VTAALTAALRACAAGLYPGEAGVELLISHGGFLDRRDFSGFIRTATSISDGITNMAQIDWDAAISALHDGQLPVCGGERAPDPGPADPAGMLGGLPSGPGSRGAGVSLMYSGPFGRITYLSNMIAKNTSRNKATRWKSLISVR
jgi:hypothetical protein